MTDLIGRQVTLKTPGKVISKFSNDRLVLDIGGRWLEVHPDEIELVNDEANALT